MVNINDIYEKHGEYIRRAICSIVSKKYNGKYPTLASSLEDCENECWILITKQIHNFNPEKSALRTFLVLVAKSQLNMLYKKDSNYKNRAMQTSSSLDKQDGDKDDTSFHEIFADVDNFAHLENEQMVNDIFSCLNPEEVKYLQLHVVQKVPLKQINTLLNWNVSENSLNTKSSRILKRIRTKVFANLAESMDF